MGIVAGSVVISEVLRPGGAPAWSFKFTFVASLSEIAALASSFRLYSLN